jgi:murein DD-endopeptidase MepM/ murein hydrolase activator NlpD
MGHFRLGVMCAGAGFLLGAVAMAALVWTLPIARAPVLGAREAPVIASASPPIAPLEALPAIASDAAALSLPAPTPTPIPDAPPVFGDDPIADLRQRHLDVPVQNVARAALVESFSDMRGALKHEGIDILAPRNTPIVAVEDGVIAKLFLSVPGGITIYQFDPTAHYAYYYAHLERYADDLAEGAHVTRLQVLGYVGTSGNAPKGTPHLHFSIFKLTDKKQWWQGTPIDPYLVFK